MNKRSDKTVVGKVLPEYVPIALTPLGPDYAAMALRIKTRLMAMGKL